MISLAFPQPDSECLCTPTSEPVIPLVLAAAAVTLAFPCIILLVSFVTGRVSPKSCTLSMLDHGVSFLRWSLLPGKTIAPGVRLSSVQPTKEEDSKKIYKGPLLCDTLFITSSSNAKNQDLCSSFLRKK